MNCFICKTKIEDGAIECPGCGNPVAPDKNVEVDEEDLLKFWERFNRVITADDMEAKRYDEVANPGTWQLIIDMAETIVKQLTAKHAVIQFQEDMTEQLKGIFFCGLRAGYFMKLIEERRENTPVPFHEKNLPIEELREKLFGQPFNEEHMWRMEIKPLIKEIIALFNDLMITELERILGEESGWSKETIDEVNSLIFSSILNGYKIATIEEELLADNPETVN